MISEGIGYVHGNLGRDWESRDVTAQGDLKTIWTNAVAYQPSKDDETIWVNLTVWPDNSNSDAEGRKIAESSRTGDRVIIRGKVDMSTYADKKTNEQKTSWNMKVWGLGVELRPAMVESRPSAAAPSVPKNHEPF